MVANARIAEADIAVLGQPPTSARIAEADIAVLGQPPTACQLAEADIAVLAYVGECGTQRCDLWKITRKDGRVFAFTSLDRDFEWMGQSYKHCASLADTASEQSSELGQIGSVELTGILDDDSITAEDIYAGLFDDAAVELWVVNWGDEVDEGAPFRVAAGWIGQLSFGQASFTAEVVGPTARLKQTALVEFFTPGCRWDFGSDECGVDAEALALVGVNVTSARDRSTLFFDAPSPGGTAIWNGGTVRWTYGENAGIECQVDTVDFSAQALSLWDLAPRPPKAGDQFDLIPGCPKDKASCVVYANLINFGGFPDVPGPDALQQNADALFTAS
jgi:uncharacterized phage protein (TIGR02218 family)